MPVHIPSRFALELEAQSGNQVTLTPRGGVSLSRAAAEVIEFARGNPALEVSLRFNSTKVGVSPHDSIAAVEGRYDETSKREREAFLASPAGQEYQREQDARVQEEASRSAAAKRLLDDLASKSTFRFPEDTPVIFSRRGDLEVAVRNQLLVGAQWLTDHPGANPFAPGQARGLKELEDLMTRTDTVAHSGSSFGKLMHALKTIADMGFDGYLQALKQAQKSHPPRT